VATIPLMPEPAPGEPGSVLAEKASLPAAAHTPFEGPSQVAATVAAPVGFAEAMLAQSFAAAFAGGSPAAQPAPQVASAVTELPGIVTFSPLDTPIGAWWEAWNDAIEQLYADIGWPFAPWPAHPYGDDASGDVTYTASDFLSDWFFG
jgi:hypothetical protein